LIGAGAVEAERHGVVDTAHVVVGMQAVPAPASSA
jgi:hypothetical protein